MAASLKRSEPNEPAELKEIAIAASAQWFGIADNDARKLLAKHKTVNAFMAAIGSIETPADLRKFGLNDPQGDKGGPIMRNLKRAKSMADRFSGFARNFEWAAANKLTWNDLDTVTELQWEAFRFNPLSLLPRLIDLDVEPNKAFSCLRVLSKSDVANRYAVAWLRVRSKPNGVRRSDVCNFMVEKGCSERTDDLEKFDPSFGIVRDHDLFSHLDKGDGTIRFESASACASYVKEFRAAQRTEFYELANTLVFDTTVSDSGFKTQIVYTLQHHTFSRLIPIFFSDLIQDIRSTPPREDEDRASTDATASENDSCKRRRVREDADERIDA